MEGQDRVIKELVEQNQNMNFRLVQAQEEAEDLIRYTMIFNKNNSRDK